MRAAPVLLAFFLSGKAGAAPFSPNPSLDFSSGAEKLKKDCAHARERAKSALAAVAALPESVRTFENTPEAVENAAWDLSDRAAADQFLKYVSTSAAVREAANDCETKVSQFSVLTYSDPALFAALSAYAAKGETLSGERKRLLDRELRDFKRAGMGLSPDKYLELRKLRLRLAEIEADFIRNLSETKDSLLLTRAELEGLDEEYIQELPREGEQYRVTLDYYFPFIENVRSPKARQLLETMYDDRAAAKNLPLLEEALRLRHRAALLLGYPSHAAFVLEERMAKTPAAALSFLETLEKRLKPMAKKELAVLLDLKKEEEGKDSDGILHAWDWPYYDHQLKKTRYGLEKGLIREYFPAGAVTAGLLSVYERLLGIKFREVQGPAAWHPEVRLFEIADAQGGETLAWFYLDLFPREGKFRQEAAFELIKARRLSDGSYQKPVSALVANLARPSRGRPGLLSHADVEILFHEFGHVMHQTLAKARYGRFSGTSVARDFVEAPSQMLQNWVWSPEVLPLLSGHYKDPARKLPPDLLDKMLAARNVDSGLYNLRQVFLARIDLRYHMADQVGDATKEWEALQKRISLVPMAFGTHPEASFGHLMGYDAGVYGYLWSKVYAQDMFSRFEEAGLMSPAIGRLYREQILEPGSSKDERELLRAFLGREPDEKAFLKSIGYTGT